MQRWREAPPEGINRHAEIECDERRWLGIQTTVERQGHGEYLETWMTRD